MRKRLAVLEDERKRFTGTFARFGVKRNFKGVMEKTLLLTAIRESGNGNIVSDHVWFNYTQSFADAGFLKEGDVLEFDARVKLYQKGYVNRREGVDERKPDYRLSHPTRVERRI